MIFKIYAGSVIFILLLSSLAFTQQLSSHYSEGVKSQKIENIRKPVKISKLKGESYAFIDAGKTSGLEKGMGLKVGRYVNGQLIEMAEAEIIAIRQNVSAIKLISMKENYTPRLGDRILFEGSDSSSSTVQRENYLQIPEKKQRVASSPTQPKSSSNRQRVETYPPDWRKTEARDRQSLEPDRKLNPGFKPQSNLGYKKVAFYILGGANIPIQDLADILKTTPVIGGGFSFRPSWTNAVNFEFNYWPNRLAKPSVASLPVNTNVSGQLLEGLVILETIFINRIVIELGAGVYHTQLTIKEPGKQADSFTSTDPGAMGGLTFMIPLSQRINFIVGARFHSFFKINPFERFHYISPKGGIKFLL